MIAAVSTYVTVGMVLDQAHLRGLTIDVELASGRALHSVTVAALEQYSVVLLAQGGDGRPGRAHVVAREHVVGVSLDSAELLALEG